MQILLGLIGVVGEFAGVFETRTDVVDGTGADNDEKSVVFLLDDFFGCLAAVGDGLSRLQERGYSSTRI